MAIAVADLDLSVRMHQRGNKSITRLSQDVVVVCLTVRDGVRRTSHVGKDGVDVVSRAPDGWV